MDSSPSFMSMLSHSLWVRPWLPLEDSRRAGGFGCLCVGWSMERDPLERDLGQQSSNRYRCGACILRLSGAVAALEAVGFDDSLVCGAFVLGVPGQVQ